MAVSGTITSHYNEFREWIVNANDVLTASQSSSFRGRGLPNASFMVTGTWSTSTSTTVQLQGSNDNVNFINLGIPLTAASGTTPQGASVNPDGFFFSFYQFVVTGGDAGTDLNIQVRFSANGI
jgi:hypothetical protein